MEGISMSQAIYLPLCLTMFLIRVTLIMYFNGHYYISVYTDLIALQHCKHRHKNTVSFIQV